MTLFVIFYPYHFVRTFLSMPFCNTILSVYHFVHAILSNTILSVYHFVRIPFCPYHFVRYHFVLEPLFAHVTACICIFLSLPGIYRYTQSHVQTEVLGQNGVHFLND